LISSSLAPFSGVLGNLWPVRAVASSSPSSSLVAVSAEVPLAKSSARDVRIDVLRGCAHLAIFIDHIPGNPAANFTPQALGLSDASEVFVFLSGLVCGLVYTRTLLARGWAATWGKALRRVAQVYVASLACLLAMVALVAVSPHRLPGNGVFYRFFSDAPAAAFRDAVVLRTTPGLIDVLYLYLVLLLALPVGLWLFRRGGRAALLSVSVGVYLLDQFGVVRPPAVTRQWFFDPIAWQLLFFIGVSLGAPRANPRPATTAATAARRCPGEYRLVGVAAFVLVVVLVVMHVDVASAAAPATGGRVAARTHLSLTANAVFPLAGKPSLEPVRLAYFLVLAYVCAAVIPTNWSFFRTGLGRALATTGRHSLPVFCVGRVLSCGGELVLHAAPGSAVAAAVTNVAGCAFLLGFAGVLEARRVAKLGARSIR
jgi:hypothetical protein